MKKTTLGISLAVLLAMGTTAAIADDHGGKHMRGDHIGRMAEHLELTPAQQSQLLELRHERGKEMLARRQEMQARRAAGEEIDREAMRAEMQSNRTQMSEELKEILTDEQWAKFEQHRAERMEQGPRGKDPKGMRGEDNRS